MLEMATHNSYAKGSSPSENAILIQRFLARLSAYVGADEAETWRSDPRFHYNIQALQDLISATEKSGSSCEVIPELHDQIRDFMAQAQEYQAALDLANVPGYVEPCQEVDDSTSTQLDTSSPDGAVSDAHAKAFSALRASGPNDRLMNAKDLGGDVYNRLSAQEDIQEELTDQMVSMAAQLRSQAEAQSKALHTRDVALDSAAQGLLKSVHGVTAVVSDTKTAVKRTRRSVFFTLFLLIGVAITLLGMYGFINITAATQAFVPYYTVASTWNKPRAQAPQQPQTVRPITTHTPPAAPAAPAPSEADVESKEADVLVPDTGADRGEEDDEQEEESTEEYVLYEDSDTNRLDPEPLQSLIEEPSQQNEVIEPAGEEERVPADALIDEKEEQPEVSEKPAASEEQPADDGNENGEQGEKEEEHVDDGRIEQASTDVEQPSTEQLEVDDVVQQDTAENPVAADTPNEGAQPEEVLAAHPNEEAQSDSAAEITGAEQEQSSQAPSDNGAEASTEPQSLEVGNEQAAPTTEDIAPADGVTQDVAEPAGVGGVDADSEPSGSGMSEEDVSLSTEGPDEIPEHDSDRQDLQGSDRLSSEPGEPTDSGADDSTIGGGSHDEL